MTNKDLVLVGVVFIVCLALVGYLYFTNNANDTGVNEVLNKYVKLSEKVEKVNSTVTTTKVSRQTNKEYKVLANLALKYKDKMEKAVNYLNNNYKNLVGKDIKFKLMDINNTVGYIVLYLNVSSGNQTAKVISLLSKKNDTLLIGNIIPSERFGNISGSNVQEVVNKLIDTINSKQKGKIFAKLYNYSIKNDLLVVLINVSKDNRSAIFPVVLTQDGKYIISDVLTLNLNKKIEPPKPPEPPKQKPIPKTDKPKVEVFVMSYCPFGVQMERALLPVIDLFKDKVDFEIKFVDYAMHNKKEIDENLRQYCIQKIDKEEYWKYLKCFIKTGNSTLCLNNISIDINKLNSCINETSAKYNVTLTYPRFLVNEEENKKYGVQGSPTTFINGVEYVGPRSPEAIKEAICSAFNEKPPECNVKLSDEWAKAGFGSGVEAQGSCG